MCFNRRLIVLQNGADTQNKLNYVLLQIYETTLIFQLNILRDQEYITFLFFLLSF
jgi:hypothetical protein